jgi:hypothetical protein
MSKDYDFSSRYKHTMDTKDGDFTRSSIFDFKDEPQYFKPKKGANKIDVVPYLIKNKNHPLVQSKDKKIGDPDYVYDIWEHKFIGPNKESVVCVYRSFKRPCPICEAAQAAYLEGDEKAYKDLKAKRRCYYNVLAYDEDGKREDKMRVWDTSYAWGEAELVDAAQNGGDEPVNFASPKNGKTVRFRAVDSDLTPQKKGGEIPLKYKSFVFLDRDSIEDYVEDALSFDEFVKVLSYEELKSAMEGEEVKEKEDSHDEEESSHKAEKDEKEPPRKAKGEENKCPSNFQFGVDTDDYKECSSCKVWSACDKANV